MATLKGSSYVNMVEQNLSAWFQALEDAPVVQHKKMMELLSIYDCTEFGQRSHAGSVETYNTYKAYLPIITYESLSPYMNSIYSGEYEVLLADTPKAMILSRTAVKGYTKTIPTTSEDLRQRVQAWPRSLFSFVYKTGRYDTLNGAVLNLSDPSYVTDVAVGQHMLPAGYASGIIARMVPKQYGIQYYPPQEELDTHPQDLSEKNWRKRFDFILKQIKGIPITMVKGNVSTVIEFGRYVKRRLGNEPKRYWNISVIVCTGTVGIHAKYKLTIRGLFGDCIILETYDAAEGAFAQQLDESPVLVPNYDLYFYEVLTENGPKPLYSMMTGEQGELIISTSVLPRMKIGDTIKCTAPNKFIVLGPTISLGRLTYDMFTSKSQLATDKDIW